MPVLVSHPTTPQPLVHSLEVEVARSGEAMELRYRLRGDLSHLYLPPLSCIEQGDRLWEHTCFELFVRPAAQHGYIELNFAPSGGFAAYRFESYREGMQAVVAAPRLNSRRDAASYELEARVPISQLDELQPSSLDLALSAVIEDLTGARSYWALAHPTAKPDFHHPQAFQLSLQY